MASNNALGLYADGVDLKVARVSRHGSKVALLDLYSAKLFQKLEIAEPIGAGGFDSGPEPLDLTQPETAETSEVETNASVVTEVFNRYGKKKNVLALSIGEPYVFYHPVEVQRKLKHDKIIKRIVEELQATRTGITKERVKLLTTTSDSSFVGVVREREVPVLDLVMSARPFLGSKMPKISFVESSDISLVNLVKNNYALKSNEVTVIVYVGVEYTRLIFMRGRDLFNIAPLISEGADSMSVQNTIYSRILLGQDNLSLPRIDKVVLCGECKNFDIKGFLSSLLVGAEVDYLQLKEIDVSHLSAGGADLVPQFAIPIASAVRAVSKNQKGYYIADLTPDRVVESQKRFKLAWHGLALTLVVFASTFYFTYNYAANESQIRAIHTDIVNKRGQVAQINALRAQIKNVSSQIGKYSVATALLDSLMPNTNRWANLIASLSNSIDRVGNMWLTDLHQINMNTYSIEGFSVYRNRIPRLAEIYPGSILRKVTVADIRGKTVYDFQIDLTYVGK